MYGPYSHLIYWAKKVNGDVRIVITDLLSMLFSKFYALLLPGETCHLITGAGKTPSVAFVADATRVSRARLQERLRKEPDYEWLMIDASHIKVHPHASGAQGGNQDMGVTKGR
jgi:hypothetical protein